MDSDEELEMIRRRKIEKLLNSYEKGNKPSSVHNTESLPLSLSDATFDNFIHSNERAVIDLWAPWCGPCRMISPILDEFSRDYAGRIIFGKVNVDENPVTANRFQVMSIPTVLLLKNTRVVDRIVGVLPRNVLKSRIERALLNL